MRRIVVKIDNLVLKGFRHEDRYAIAQGLQDQLTQLFAEPSMMQRLRNTGSIPRLQVGPVQMAADAKPQQIGRATADGIGRGLRR